MLGGKQIPQRLKPSIFGGFTAGLKPRPFRDKNDQPFKAKNDTENDAAIYLIS
jgi:hypothetical protein